MDLGICRIMKNDSDLPKLNGKQKVQLVIIGLVLISMMVLAAIKLTLLFGILNR